MPGIQTGARRRLALHLLLCLSAALVAACAPPAQDDTGSADGGAAEAQPAEGARQPTNLPFFRESGQDPAAEGALAWDEPEGWIPVEPASRMRWAQYALPPEEGDTEEGECVVFYFGPGQGGDARANADRWATQFSGPDGQPPEPQIEQTETGGRKVMKVFVEGTYAPSMTMGTQPEQPRPGFKLLGAIVEGPDANWFFKCTGPTATMDANRGAFDGMIASIH